MNNTCDLYPFDLGDKRLDRRAGRIIQAALDHAGDGIPTAAGNRAAADAAYRFLDNPNVDPHDLDDAHARSTVDLAGRYPGVLLIAQDTTDADFTSPARGGRLGQLAHAKHFGFFVHSALAMTADGLPLGLLHQHVRMRPPRPTRQTQGSPTQRNGRQGIATPARRRGRLPRRLARRTHRRDDRRPRGRLLRLFRRRPSARPARAGPRQAAPPHRRVQGVAGRGGGARGPSKAR